MTICLIKISLGFKPGNNLHITLWLFWKPASTVHYAHCSLRNSTINECMDIWKYEDLSTSICMRKLYLVWTATTLVRVTNDLLIIDVSLCTLWSATRLCLRSLAVFKSIALIMLMTPRYISRIHLYEPSHISNCSQDLKDWLVGNDLLVSPRKNIV